MHSCCETPVAALLRALVSTFFLDGTPWATCLHVFNLPSVAKTILGSAGRNLVEQAQAHTRSVIAATHL